jgi:cell wall-associated protease
MKLSLKCLAIGLLLWTAASGQHGSAPENWFNLDPKRDGVPGVSTEKTYEELLKGVRGETVIVAVLDGGIDFAHEDLAPVMWRNPGEISGNGIDDDDNGYVDDVYGWNFIGGKNGENVHHDNLEVARLYQKYRARFEGKSAAQIDKNDRELFENFQEYKEEVKEKREDAAQNLAIYGGIYEAVKSLKEAIGKDDISIDDLKNFKSNDPLLSRSALIVTSLMSEGSSFESIFGDLTEVHDYYYSKYNYHYNPDFDPRHIVGDNYADKYERYYGNNNVKGPDAVHGTHVAGIIGAVRGNDTGMDGVADNVRIMAVRVVPDGDERDKDVANAIIYAVDNGAKVINMSFGKGYSPHKDVVDKAVRYAEKHDVLLVHAAGNSGQENFSDNNFPNDRYLKKGLFRSKYAENWIEVGALHWKGGEDLAAAFSNYSPDNVDVFAPGVDIYSTAPEDEYKHLQGTSMAAPVVSGVAAVLRSYFPDLTAKQVKAIIMNSVDQQNIRVKKPGSDELVPFSRLCVSGGTVNLYKAVQLASQTKGKKRGKTRYLGPHAKPQAAAARMPGV